MININLPKFQSVKIEYEGDKCIYVIDGNTFTFPAKLSGTIRKITIEQLLQNTVFISQLNGRAIRSDAFYIAAKTTDVEVLAKAISQDLSLDSMYKSLKQSMDETESFEDSVIHVAEITSQLKAFLELTTAPILKANGVELREGKWLCIDGTTRGIALLALKSFLAVKGEQLKDFLKRAILVKVWRGPPLKLLAKSINLNSTQSPLKTGPRGDVAVSIGYWDVLNKRFADEIMNHLTFVNRTEYESMRPNITEVLEAITELISRTHQEMIEVKEPDVCVEEPQRLHASRKISAKIPAITELINRTHQETITGPREVGSHSLSQTHRPEPTMAPKIKDRERNHSVPAQSEVVDRLALIQDVAMRLSEIAGKAASSKVMPVMYPLNVVSVEIECGGMRAEVLAATCPIHGKPLKVIQGPASNSYLSPVAILICDVPDCIFSIRVLD